jgi:type I restriction enzyme M protein
MCLVTYTRNRPFRNNNAPPVCDNLFETFITEHAWRVPVEQVIANGFNLDIKNPNVVPDDLGDPVELLREYERIRAEAVETREVLKRELMASLGAPDGKKT